MKLLPDQQCPACHFQRIENICGQGRRRIYQTDIGEFFRNIDCPIFEERKIEIGKAGPQVCPTCGRPLDEVVINSPQIDIVLPVGEITSNNETWDIPISFESVDDVSPNQGISPIAETVPEPKKRTKRRGFKDIPKARFRKSKHEFI